METSVIIAIVGVGTLLFGLITGIITGWFITDKYNQMLVAHEHDFEELFKENPHPEIFDKDGKIVRSDYMAINFDLGYDPEDFDPEDIIREG